MLHYLPLACAAMAISFDSTFTNTSYNSALKHSNSLTWYASNQHLSFSTNFSTISGINFEVENHHCATTCSARYDTIQYKMFKR